MIIVYHFPRVECNTFTNWIYLKIFPLRSKNIFTKPKKNIIFILIHFFLHYGVQITYNMTRKMHDDDIVFKKKFTEDVLLREVVEDQKYKNVKHGHWPYFYMEICACIEIYIYIYIYIKKEYICFI